MMKSNEYSEMMSSIHAPKKLEDQVLRAVRKDEKKRKGAYSRGFSFVQKAAVAAVLLMALPVTAYAAIKYTSLSEHFGKYLGYDKQALETLAVTTPTPSPSEALEHSNEYAQFHVAETAWDGTTLLVTAEMRPVSDKYFLVPGELDENLSVDNLNLEGVSGDQTIGEYAASLGKIPVMVSMGFYRNGEFMTGSLSSQCFPDGVVRQYHSLNGANGDATVLTCSGVVSGPTISDEVWLNDRVKFDIEIKNSSSHQNTNDHVFTVFDKNLPDYLHIQSLTFRDTELCTYATFTYSITPQADELSYLGGGYSFYLTDKDGNWLPGTMLIDNRYGENSDGTFTFTLGYEQIENYDDLYFELYDFNNPDEDLIYSIGK